MRQLTIPFLLQDHFKFELFIKSDDSWSYDFIKNWCATDVDDRFCWLWGGAGSGKTHLLHSICHHMTNIQRCFYIDLANYSCYSPDVLYGLDAVSLICIDNVYNVFLNKDWEVALFNLYNDVVVNSNRKLICSAPLPFSTYVISLPDLASRLASAVQVELRCLQDEALVQALILRSHSMGFALSYAVARYLVIYQGSCSHCLFGHLDVLSKVSLEMQRKVTVSLVKLSAQNFKRCGSCEK